MSKEEIQDLSLTVRLETGKEPDTKTIQNLLMAAKTLHKLYEHQCNGSFREKLPSETWKQYQDNCNTHQIPWIEKQIAKREAIVARHLAALGVSAKFNQDPRGYPVKIHTPKCGRYNTWGGSEDGFGIG